MAKITKWLNIYKTLDEDLNALMSSGHYTLLYSSFMTLFESLGSAVHKENLKIITSKIIDYIWDYKYEYSEVAAIPPLEFSLSVNQSKSVGGRLSSVSAKDSLKKIDYSLLSDFSYTKGGTFSRGNRKVKTEISPGPGQYEANYSLVRDKPPSVITSSARKELKKSSNSTTPGPGAYSPLFAFKSR